jgi:hypothetical protein
MTVGVKFSNEFNAKQNRIKAVPKLIDGMLFGIYKRDSAGIVKEYQDGIRTDSLGLERLKAGTIKRKEAKGLSKPSVPLYAWGDDQKMSLINCLRIRKLKNGWKIVPSKGMHHQKDGGKPIALDFLHKIHEYGAIIPNKGKSKSRFGEFSGMKGKPIRILPRPALNRAYRFHLRKLKNRWQETSRNVKKAIASFIEMADRSEIDNLIAYNKRYKELERE